MMRKIDRENLGVMRPGQDLVVAGYAGHAGTQRIVNKKRDRLRLWFSEDYLDQIITDDSPKETYPLEYWKSFGVTECEPAGDGGILRTLWDLSGAYETGITFSLRRIPVRQSTIEICERFELNPYRLYSGGCYLLTADNGGHLVEVLAAEGIPSAVIGTVDTGIARVMIHGEGRGFLERPQPDEWNKIS